MARTYTYAGWWHISAKKLERNSHCCCCVWRSFQFSPSAISWKDRRDKESRKQKADADHSERQHPKTSRPRPHPPLVSAPGQAPITWDDGSPTCTYSHVSSSQLFQASCVLLELDRWAAAAAWWIPQTAKPSAWRSTLVSQDRRRLRSPAGVPKLLLLGRRCSSSLAKRAILQAPEHKNFG
jgi:hypothetical protein